MVCVSYNRKAFSFNLDFKARKHMRFLQLHFVFSPKLFDNTCLFSVISDFKDFTKIDTWNTFSYIVFVVLVRLYRCRNILRASYLT